MEARVVTWGWMGGMILLLGSLGGIAVHCDLIRFSYHHLLRASVISSHLWWAIKHFPLRKHILDSGKNSHQIVYRCLDSPSNQKDIQSHSLSSTGHIHTPMEGGIWAGGAEKVFGVFRGQLLPGGRVEINSTSFWYDFWQPTMAFHSPYG